MALVACSECHAQVSDKAASCPHCGNVFSRCPECTSEVRPGAATCPNCGHPLTVAQAASASPYDPRQLPDNTQAFAMAGAPVVYAGFWRRFAAAFIDGIILLVVLSICDIILNLSLGTGPAAPIVSTLNFGAGLAYYIGLESSARQA